MLQVSVSLTGVIVAAVASIVLGFVWYSDSLFGKKWKKLVGAKGKMKMDAKSGLTMLVSALLTAFVLRT